MQTVMSDHQFDTTHSTVCWSWGPRHYGCALREIEVLRAEVCALRAGLAALISWFPSADTYRRLGFDPKTPMQVLKEAKALLLKGDTHEELEVCFGKGEQ